VQYETLFRDYLLRTDGLYAYATCTYVPRVEPPMNSTDLTETDRAILDELRDGRATKGALVEWTGYSRNSIYNRLEVLEAAGFIKCVHGGTRLFELISDPRESE
jgi:uncharacterized membrane protein